MQERPTSVLLPERQQFPAPRLATAVLWLILLLKLAFISMVLTTRWLQPQELWAKVKDTALLAMFAEVVLTNAFVFLFCRWESQGHWTSVWSFLTGLGMLALFFEILADPIYLLVTFVLARVTHWTALHCDLTRHMPARLPPFALQKDDDTRKPWGWFGQHLASWVQGPRLRRVISAFSFLLVLRSPWLDLLMIAIFNAFWLWDWVPAPSGSTLYWQFIVAQLGLFTSSQWGFNVIRLFYSDGKAHLTEKCCLPSTTAFRQEENEVVVLDQNPWRGEATPHCRPLTIVLACYMPNEEDTIFGVLKSHREQCSHYPAPVHFLMFWNSPKDHEHTVARLDRLEHDWPQFRHHRVQGSTSKADNLNHSLQKGQSHSITTEWVLFLDADTLFSAQTLIYANECFFENSKKLDWVQGRWVFPREDLVRCSSSGCNLARAMGSHWDADITEKSWLWDEMGFYPFMGHAAWWRTEAIQALGFDHRTMGEDWDLTIRAKDYFGLRGAFDPNLLFSERTPPSWRTLLKRNTRWLTTGYQLRANLGWTLRSRHLSGFEKLTRVAWQVGYWSMPLPLQSFPGTVACLMRSVVLGVITMFAFRQGLAGGANTIALLVYLVLLFVELGLSELSMIVREYRNTLFKPRFLVALWHFPVYLFRACFTECIRMEALHNFLWGISNWTVTPRSTGNKEAQDRELPDSATDTDTNESIVPPGPDESVASGIFV